MRIILGCMFVLSVLATPGFSGVYVVEGFEEFEAASAYELFDIMGDKIVDENKAIRRKAVRFLSNLFNKREIVLGHYLKDGSQIRLLTYDTMKVDDAPKSLKDKAVEHLIFAAAEPDYYIRKTSVRALGNSGDRRAIKPLEYLLTVEENPSILKEINKALNKLESAPPAKND